MNDNVVGWFEVPVSDMDRAISFYEKVFNFKLIWQDLDGIDMAWFPFVEDGTGTAGSLIHVPEFYTPSQDGVLIYFTAMSGDLENELSRVEAAGGKVLISKRQISEEVGYMGVFIDSEGNRIALHSRK